MTSAIRPRTIVRCDDHGHPRTLRLAPAKRDAAYRRLAVAILGLDVATLAFELRSAKRRTHLLPAAA